MMKIEELTMKQIKGMIRQYNRDLKIVRYSKLSKPDLIQLLKDHPNLKISELKDKVRFEIKDYSVKNKPVIEITKETKILKPGQKKKLTESQKKQFIKQVRDKLKKGVGNPEPKPAPKKEPKPQPKKEPKPAPIISDLEDFVKKYNKDEIKKEKLTKENLKKFTNKYFDILDKIKQKIEEIEDPNNFFKDNLSLIKKYNDIEKNFVRRVKAQFKKTKK